MKGKAKEILVVEDTLDVGATVKGLLEDWGYKVKGPIGDRAEAEKLIRERKFRGVTLDGDLREESEVVDYGADGRYLFAVLQEVSPQTPVIALVGRGSIPGVNLQISKEDWTAPLEKGVMELFK